MTFKHKLSCRLALTRDMLPLLATAAVLVSCELPTLNNDAGSGAIARIAVVPESLSLDPSQQTQFVAYGITAAGDSSDLSVTWSATGGSISTTGMFVADTAAGDFLVSGTSDALKLSGSARVRIRPRKVASVTVTPTAAGIVVGQTVQLAATPRDANGNILSGRLVTWGSSSSGVASVSGGGLVTGAGAGSATISATSDGKTGTATIAVTLTAAPVASVGVSPASPSVVVGQTVQLVATPRDVNGNALPGRAITWSSSNTAVGTVSASGLVTGVASGTATITATSEGQSGPATLTVTVPVASVSVSPGSASLTPGQTVQLAATPRDANGNALSGRVITWSSNRTNVATVSTSGLVTGVGGGTATITATSEGQSGSAAVTVTVPVASVGVSPASASVGVGQTVQLTATPRDANGNALTGRVVTWTSSNTGVATVSSGGVVTGVAAGSATITATSEGQGGAAAVTVTVPVASVSVSPASASVTAGQTVQLTATPRDANGNALTGRVVTWSSSNTGVATVSSSGVVTGVVAGSATLTATSEGKSGTSQVTVQASSGSSECATPQPGWLWCDDFDVNRLSSYYEYDNAGGKFARVTGVGRNGSYGMRAQFAAGDVSVGSLHLAFGKTPSSYWEPVDAGTALYRDLYWRFYVRNQPGWTPSTDTDKMTRALVFAGTNFSEAAFAHAWSGSGAATNYLILDPASGTDAAGNLVTTQYNDFRHMTWLGLVQGTTPLFSSGSAGNWYCVELHARLNDAGQSNGVFEYWVNGGIEARKTGMNWLGSYSQFAWNAVFLENYVSPAAPASQERYFDNFVVSTQRIGC